MFHWELSARWCYICWATLCGEGVFVDDSATLLSTVGFVSNSCWSEAWGPAQFQDNRSRSEKVILGALGEFQGILGATLGIQKVILGMRDSILGMASHDLSNRKPPFSEQLLERFPKVMGTFFSRIGVVPARQSFRSTNQS